VLLLAQGRDRRDQGRAGVEIMVRVAIRAAFGIVAAAWAQGAVAQSTGSPAPAPGWTVTLGVEGRVVPAFEGASRYVVAPYPAFDVRRAGTPRRFSSPRDGIGIGLLDLGTVRAGPAGKIALPRGESRDPALRGLGDVGWTVELGGFVEYWPLPWLRGRGELRHGIGGHSGIVAEFAADVVVPATPQLTVSAGPRLTLASAAALRPYFGVNATQAAASGLPLFDPKGGVRAVGFGAQAHQQWTPQWATYVFVEYDRLLGDAAGSPVLRRGGSADQAMVGLGITYSFDLALP
jgi:outer membrane protein